MIVAHDLWKRFDGADILKGLSITIKTGETLVILGRSGVGKSVLLKHIIGILTPDRGTISIDGKEITTLKSSSLYTITKYMGMLFQNAALFDSMNIGENTAFYLRQHPDLVSKTNLSKSEIDDRVAEALDMVGLSGIQKKMPSDLSGGMKKRAALARLIVYRPRILLYDEPTTGLDPITAMQINELIIKIQYELNATSIVVTHDIISSLKVGDRLALHHDGKITHIAERDEFILIDDPIIKDFLKNALVLEGDRRHEQ